MTGVACHGAGCRWQPGTGHPMCPVCHAGPGALGVRLPRRNRKLGGWQGLVPEHNHHGSETWTPQQRATYIAQVRNR